jgi:hypothetical protein
MFSPFYAHLKQLVCCTFEQTREKNLDNAKKRLYLNALFLFTTTHNKITENNPNIHKHIYLLKYQFQIKVKA